MLTSKEAEAIEPLLKWLTALEETVLFEDWVRLGFLKREEMEAAYCVLHDVIKRHKDQPVSAEGLRLCRIMTLERNCLGCDREGVPLNVMARTPEDAKRLLFSDELGLCDECLCGTLIEAKVPVVEVTTVKGDSIT